MKHIFRFLLICLLTYPINLKSQLTPYFAKVNTPPTIDAGKPLSMSIELTQGTTIQRAVLSYRQFGESEFRELEMLITGRTATVTVPAEYIVAPAIEYFVTIELPGDRKETYPAMNPEGNPVRLNIKERDPKDDEVKIMSPEPGETVATDEFALVVSLFYASDNVKRQGTKLFVDGVDVSKEAMYAEEMITWAPKKLGVLKLGAHSVRIELYDNAGKLYHKIESSFNLSTAFAIEEEKEKFHFGASGQAEYRNEKIDTTSTTYSRLDIRTTGTYSWLNLGTYFHLDNQEVGGRQPQNRYLLTAETGWLRLQYGDAYPYYPTLIASGKRIRGITGNLSLGGYLNVDASYGETERKIEGYVLYQQEYDTSTHSSRPTNSLLVRDSADVKWWYDIFQRGTYTRKFLAVRPSFGSGETFQWGLTYMKAIDDTGSIKYGITPAENLVVGTDLLFNFFDDKFRWESQAAVSVNNTDIQGGSWTQADYDSMKANDPKTGKDLEDLGKLADKFITINENVFPSNPVGPGMPSIAFESILSLNVLNNFVRATYFRRGAAYKSFGNEFLQTDIQGYSVSDRIRMLSNKVFLSVSWEDKKDNTANTKTATTRYTNLNTSLNLNIAAGYPSFVFGYGLIGRLSDKLVTKKEIVGIQNYKATGIGDDSTSTGYTADDKSTRLFIATNYDFKLGARHSFTFSYSGLDRKDNSLYKRDQQNSNIQGSLTTYFDFPLQTFFSALISNSRSYRNDIKTNGADSTYFSEFKYTALSLGAQYRMMNDDLRVTFAVAPIFGDFRRTALQTGADYTVAVGHNIEFRLDIVQNTAKTSTGTERSYTDVITSLVYRFDF